MPRRKVIPQMDSVKENESSHSEEKQNTAETHIVNENKSDSASKSRAITLAATDNSSRSSGEDDTGDSSKRNLSLEALFQAAHSELENISKETVTDGTPQAVKKQILSRMSSSSEQGKVGEVVTYLEVPQEMEKGNYVIKSRDAKDGTVMGQVIKMEEPGCSLTPLQESGTKAQVVHLVPDAENPVQVKSSNVRDHPLKLTQAIVIGAMPEDYQGKRAFTPELTKLFVVNSTMSPPEGLKGITTTIGGGGRKRKHPQKPGKHICPYCSRGCAKPSVLKKHIRAHTGERPYPCSTCGFAFKTKSNLYKHCKSRWHLLKVGLSKERGSDSVKDETMLNMESDESSDEERDRDNKEDKEAIKVSQAPITVESLSSLVAENTMKRAATVKLSDEMEAKKMRSFTTEDETETAVKNIKLQSGGLIIDRQMSDSGVDPVVHHVATPTTQVKHEMSMQKLFPSGSQLINSTSTVFHVTTSPAEMFTSTSSSPNLQGINISDSIVSSSGSRIGLTSTSSSNPQTAISHMNLPIIVTPSVVQSTRKPIEKSFSTNDLPDEANGQSKQKNTFSHSISLQTDSSSADDSEKKLKNPKMLLERISNLISANQAIMSTSVAIPPRKRVLRQQSTNLSVQSQSSVPSTQPNVIFQRSASLTDKLLMMKNASQGVAVVQHGDMLRSLSVPTALLTSSAGVQPEPVFVVKQIETNQDRVTTKPVMQLPQGLLPSPVGTGTAPKEIKIEFKLPKSNGPQAPKPTTIVAGPSSIGTNVNSPTRISSPVIDAKSSRTDVSQITKDKPHLSAILQGHTSGVVLGMPQHEQNSEEPTYVCGSCWQSFQDVKVLKLHQENGCLKITVPQVQVPEERKHSDKSSKSKPPKLLLPSVGEIPIQPKGTPITVVTPPTPTEPTAEKKKRGILQRQKNVIVEMVDPRQPPKRGRPKGARSVDSSFSGPTVAASEEKPTLQRSHSTIESGSSHDEIPGELRGETPQALWKLKLKGRLLMKRSMSVERMLSQERELEQNAEKQNKSALSLPSAKHLPLLRSKSYDETVTAQKKPLRDSELREKILSKLSKSCHNLTDAEVVEAGTEEERNAEEKSTKPDVTCSEDVKPNSTVPVHSEKPVELTKEYLSCAISIPVNHAADCFPTSQLTFAPYCLLQKLGTVQESWAPNMISIPVNIAHKVPGLLQEAKLKSPESTLADTKRPEQSDPEHMDCEPLLSDPDDNRTKEMAEMSDMEQNAPAAGSIPEDGQSHDYTRTDESEADEKVQASDNKKKNVCTLHTIQMAGPSKRVQDRIMVSLLLLGHSYPSMRPASLSTFCCIHKTQPMYVVLGSQHKVSMYSNWQAAPYDPNPKGLSSKQLLDLYRTERYNCETRFTMASNSGRAMRCDVTQSSYWTEKRKDINDIDMKNDVGKAIVESIKLEMFPDIRDIHLHDPVPEEKQQVPKITVESITEQPKEMHIFPTAKDKLKEALSTEKATRIRICEGGYKSMEEYVYVRGRGRGMYVCEKCGIRCKKPSMLKKHIRTHTDVRPYHCRYCNFSFKTKGNLTKHMKSKAHQKLCMDKGIIPVPTSVDDDCVINIMGDSMEENDDSIIYEDIDGPTVGNTEEVTDHQFSDAEDPGRDEDEEEEEIVSEKDPDKENMDEVQLLEVEIVTNPTTETQIETELKVTSMETEEVPVTSETQAEKSGSQSFSLDKEIAAASLLDLSKVTNSDEQVAQSEKHEDNRHNETNNKETTAETANTGEKNPLQDAVMTKDITLFSTFSYIRGQNTYAHKIALLKAANKCQTSGFAPPIGFDIGESSIVPIQSQEKWSDGKKEDTDDLGPIVGQFIRPDMTISTNKEENKDQSIALCTSSTPKTILQLAKITVTSVAGLEAKVKFVEGEGHAPCEIMPIPIRMFDEVEQVDESGRYVCRVCSKVFEKKHQLTLHRNIHLLEKPYKCEDCSLSFQSRMLLDKHQSSDRHQQQVALMQQMGATTSEDPRPFKCEECNIAFRIQGHLARHLRSKMHISKLEALGKVPVGSYDQVDFDPAAAMNSAASTAVTTAPSSMAARNSITAASTIQVLQKPGDTSHKVKVIKRSHLSATESELLVAKRPRVDSVKSDSENAKDDSVTMTIESSIFHSAPSHDSTFSYQTLDEYEKVDLASNDRVTVEIKSEPIEFNEILPKMSQKQDERETDVADENDDLSADGPHKCGICGKTFKEISFLKHHLVSHAELRPYVCEYCDAGFTTALSLKHHLPMHAQECPYHCGYCGSTFAKSELLHQHLNDFHGSPAVEQASQPAVVSHVIRPSMTTAHKSVHHTVTVNPKSQYIVQVGSQPAVSSEPEPVVLAGSQKVSEGVPSGSTSGGHKMSSSVMPTKNRVLSSAGSTVSLVRQMAVDADNLPQQKADEAHIGNMIELDLNNYEVQECTEETASGEERTVYMLVVPEGKMENVDLVSSQREGVTTGSSRRASEVLVNNRQLSVGASFRQDSLTVPQREIATNKMMSANSESQSFLDAEVASTQTDSSDAGIKWKVIHMPDMSLSPIFDNEENTEGQSLDIASKSC